MKLKILAYLSCVLFIQGSYSAENCERVDWACKLIASKGPDAKAEIKKMRFDCCDEMGYVRVSDMNSIMLIHPLKPFLENTDQSGLKDVNGKLLTKAYNEMVKKNPEGSWLEYQWTQAGEIEPKTKKTWVRGCKVGGKGETWVVGSGNYK